MFYTVFRELCTAKGVSPTRACEEMGLSRSLATKWKNEGTVPSGETLRRLSEYFGVSTDALLDQISPREPGAPPPDKTLVTINGKDGSRVQMLLNDAEYETLKKMMDNLSPAPDSDL